MQVWEAVRWLVIEITLPENRKSGAFYHKLDSCFWSKWNSYPSFWRNSAGKINPKRFLVFDFSSFHHIIIFWNQKIKKTKKQKTRRFTQNKKLEVRYTRLLEILRFSDSQIFKIHISQGCSSIFSCIFWRKFMRNTGFKGPLRVQKMSKIWKFQNPSKKYWNRSGIDN